MLTIVISIRLILAHLAYMSNRTYVFQPYRWHIDYIPWTKGELQRVHGRKHPVTPANAMMSGPAVGGSWPAGDPAPRSISEDWFDIVCPKSKRKIIISESIKGPIREENAYVHFRAWEKVLKEAPENCIEVVPSPRTVDPYPQVIELFVWGSNRILSMWEEFRDSPVSQLQRPSPVAQAAVIKNERVFLPSGPTIPGLSIDPFDRTLAIHIRRGDYKSACVRFGIWNSSFYGWNQLPDMPDRFVNPPGWTWGKNTPENMELYMKRCWPSEEAIVTKIMESKRDYESAAKPGEKRLVDVVFLMTNADTEWQAKMKWMLKTEGLNTVVTTKDIILDAEEKEIGLVVDMELARKAAVFVGNGVSTIMLIASCLLFADTPQWSSLTSNIIHRRRVDGREYYANRFF